MRNTLFTWNKHLAAALLGTLMTTSPMVLAKNGWINQQGQSIADTASAKSAQDFGASVLVTSDKDWQQKWNTSSDTTPNFKTANEVSVGGELFILTFLANPKLDANGMTDVSCDLTITRPDGSRSVSEVGIPCFKVKLTTPPTLVYLSSAVIQVAADATDPKGTWSVDVTVKDRLRGVSLPLHSEFRIR